MSVLRFQQPSKFGRRRLPKPILVLVLVAIAGTFATTLASNITVNSGPVEFGQGLALTTACSGDQELIFTPRAKFKNVSGAGNFVFSSISVSNIPATCSGNDFIFGFYSETGTAKLNLDSRGPQNTPYVYFTVSGETGTAAAFTKPPSNGAFSTTNVTATGFTLVDGLWRGLIVSYSLPPAGDSDSSTPKVIKTVAVEAPDAEINAKNGRSLTKREIKTMLDKKKTFKNYPIDKYKYSIFGTSKKICAINGNYVVTLEKTGACEMWVTRTTAKGAKYKYWVKINYLK